MENENIQTNTIGTSQELNTATVASTDQGHAQTNAEGQTAANTNVQPAGQGSYQPGPDQVMADYRRQIEAAKTEAAAYKAQLENPEVARFLEFQKAEKAKAEADKYNTSPELLHEINSLKQSQADLLAARELEGARGNFSSFANSQNMPAEVQTEFLGYLESVLPAELQNLAMTPGFNFEPYIHGFAVSKNAQASNAAQAQTSQVTFVPGQPTGPASTGSDMDKYIKELVSKG